MKWICTLMAPCLVVAVALAPSSTFSAPQEKDPPAHDLQFWRDIAKNNFSVPQGQSIFSLVRELSQQLGSADPEIRDDLAYTILDVWIVSQHHLSTPELVSLLSEWQNNLHIGIGEIGTDSVFRRSFSALCLAALAQRDLKAPFLAQEQYRALLENALAYLKDEQDLRGFDPIKGWIHSTAHTADLLGFLATNAAFKAEDQARVMQAISERLVSARQIFSYGEQDRLAFVVAAIVERRDFDVPAFHRWLSALEETDRILWKDSPPQYEPLLAFENNSYLLQSLAARLCAKTATPKKTAALDEVRHLLSKR